MCLLGCIKSAAPSAKGRGRASSRFVNGCQDSLEGRKLELESLELAKMILSEIEDKKGSDIVVLDIRSISLLADCFVICTVETQRQAEALADAVIPKMKEHGRFARAVEGDATSGWVLIDYGDVVVHLFSPQQRTYYGLDKLWKEAKVVVRIQ